MGSNFKVHGEAKLNVLCRGRKENGSYGLQNPIEVTLHLSSRTLESGNYVFMGSVENCPYLQGPHANKCELGGECCYRLEIHQNKKP